MKYPMLLLPLFVIGCASDPISAPVSAPKAAPSPVQPSVSNPYLYQGYAVSSRFDNAGHCFHRLGGDSSSAQIRLIEADGEIKATVSITGEDRPVDVFLFRHGGYYIGNDSVSYAYISGDYSTLVWGRASSDDGNTYKTVYAGR